MRRIEKLFEGQIPPGVYQVGLDLDIESLTQAGERHGYRVFYVDGHDIADKSSFLNGFASVMRFPDYFGYNWDAFDECIRDLRWSPAKGYLILYDHCEVLGQSKPEELDKAVEIFRDAATYWQALSTSMFVLLRCDHEIGDRLLLHKLSAFL